MSTDTKQRVIVEIQDYIAHVKLNRADKMNALDGEMIKGIIAAGEKLKQNDSIRVVVLSGEGRAFCAGLDMSSFASMTKGRDQEQKKESSDNNEEVSLSRLEERTHGIANQAQFTSWVWRQMPVPVIVAMHGVAYGGGCQISLGADIRYAAPGTKLSIMEMKWGLVPDMGATPFLQKLVGDDVARELTYTNRIILAEEAKALGLVTHVYENPIEKALETAREIASKNPEAIRASKRLLNNAPFQNPADILLAESREQDKLIGQPNQVEAIMANLQKRAPEFE